MAIKKGIEMAKKNMQTISLKGTTIPHTVIGALRRRTRAPEAGGAGTGRHRGRARVRAVLESGRHRRTS